MIRLRHTRVFRLIALLTEYISHDNAVLFPPIHFAASVSFFLSLLFANKHILFETFGGTIPSI